jgi:hypothetical protein
VFRHDGRDRTAKVRREITQGASSSDGVSQNLNATLPRTVRRLMFHTRFQTSKYAEELQQHALTTSATSIGLVIGASSDALRSTTLAAHDEVREGARQRLFHHWDIFSDMFVPSPYLSGEGPGALDYLAVVVSMWCGARDHIAKSRPSFAETLRRIQLHDAVEPVFRQHWDSVP